ncbi:MULTISPECIES: VCBS repeat-containing protein [unclassified Streptomyces]|uniref:FG-GAP repeat domain-containing protein n=1 Tax=unclassified Streptomyces TaxID=2593676 RepID=UPI000FBF396A|nr:MULTISPECIES: VCBS repeat-containing protein [unclassified Streptomyces]MCX4769108.1 VCBS repeat-containing protein [Streptomyces sp. NBC_01285]ROQ76737.1 VCBS repeat protein [Streptomyces sp. CEV 2-1]
MAKTSGRNHRSTAARAAAAALTAALVATGTSAVAADSPQPSLSAAAQPSAAAAKAAAAVAPNFALFGVNSSGNAYAYRSNLKGGLTARSLNGSGWTGVNAMLQVANVAKSNGDSDGLWFRENNGNLGYLKFGSDKPVQVGYGWNTYNKIVSPGNIGGAAAGDILARDTKGDVYVYLGYGTGKVTGRIKVGYGWDIYSEIAGNGDLNGDGKNDIVARDKSGVLWLYKGTGNQKAPFAKRTKIGSGWNQFNRLVSTGDITEDGRTDLLARDKAGALWLYRGTGNATVPYAAKVKVGTSGWNSYKFLF